MNHMTPAAPDDGVARFLTLADTAEILSITVSEADELVRSGELPAIRVGGAWRVERVVLENYIDGQYEQARRAALWQQSDFGNIPELSGGRILRPDPQTDAE
ncbi:helix-turn-helix domain-containing protein [Glaciibacter flavus]|uniref:Helix-turn-helix domain-containing protein n=2 Tax=Orlajensenia flava TaxID=2565934 RepID=A0A4S4FXE8_9MICO|nr:helix-turn-helix domain-containing protein [Glaciibacter flavus]